MSFDIKMFMKQFDLNYCQLCVELKPRLEVIDLETERGKLEDITAKLIRLNAASCFGSNQMSKTVCFVCLETLDKAYQFVLGVEHAQMILNHQTLLQNTIDKDQTTEENYNTQEILNNIEEDCPMLEDPSNNNTTNSNHMIVEKSGLNSSSLNKETWASYSWLCKYCDTQFPHIDELRTHSVKYHNSCNPYQCLDCNSRIESLNKFLKHIRKHRQHLKLSCYKCFDIFQSQYDVRKHYLQCHIQSNYICFGCNISFDTEFELNKHNSEYWKSQSPLSICNKTTKLNIKQKVKNYTCDQCGKSYYKKSSFEMHMEAHNGCQYSCQVCKSVFKTPFQLRYHYTIHTDDKPYICNECGKKFRLKRQIRSHILIHSELFPFQCHMCDKKFRLKQSYRIHVNISHLGIRPYSCDICQRDFSNWPNYNKHMKRKHNKNTSQKQNVKKIMEADPETGNFVVKPKYLDWVNKMKQIKPKKLGRRGNNKKTY